MVYGKRDHSHWVGRKSTVARTSCIPIPQLLEILDLSPDDKFWSRNDFRISTDDYKVGHRCALWNPNKAMGWCRVPPSKALLLSVRTWDAVALGSPRLQVVYPMVQRASTSCPQFESERRRGIWPDRDAYNGWCHSGDCKSWRKSDNPLRGSCGRSRGGRRMPFCMANGTWVVSFYALCHTGLRPRFLHSDILSWPSGCMGNTDQCDT